MRESKSYTQQTVAPDPRTTSDKRQFDGMSEAKKWSVPCRASQSSVVTNKHSRDYRYAASIRIPIHIGDGNSTNTVNANSLSLYVSHGHHH